MLHRSGTTIPLTEQDHPDWHRGREAYSLWLVELDDAPVRMRFEAARRHLSGLLHHPYARQPHITLFVCGFLGEAQRFDDDFSLDRLRQQERSLRDAKLRAFPVDIGGLNSFTSAPFLEVVDREGGLERIRSLLSRSGAEIGRQKFVPHVTVGLYAGAFPGDDVAWRISQFPGDALTCTVKRITFATYHAREIAGALTYRRIVPLLPR